MGDNLERDLPCGSCTHKTAACLYGSQFKIYTDHKPLKSLFLLEVKKAKILRWSVLITEYGAPIEHRKGAHNIRADMLSRIKTADAETSAMDTTEERVAANDIANDWQLQIPWEIDKSEWNALKEEM